MMRGKEEGNQLIRKEEVVVETQDLIVVAEEVEVEEEADLVAIEDLKMEVVKEEILEAKDLLKVDLKIIKEEAEAEEVNSFSSQQQNLLDRKAQNKLHLQNHYSNIFLKILLPYPLHKDRYSL